MGPATVRTCTATPFWPRPWRRASRRAEAPVRATAATAGRRRRAGMRGVMRPSDGAGPTAPPASIWPASEYSVSSAPTRPTSCTASGSPSVPMPCRDRDRRLAGDVEDRRERREASGDVDRDRRRLAVAALGGDGRLGQRRREQHVELIPQRGDARGRPGARGQDRLAAARRDQIAAGRRHLARAALQPRAVGDRQRLLVDAARPRSAGTPAGPSGRPGHAGRRRGRAR